MAEIPTLLQAVVYLGGPVTDMVFQEACSAVVRDALLALADGTEGSVPAAARLFGCEAETVRDLLALAGTAGFEAFSVSELSADRFHVYRVAADSEDI